MSDEVARRRELRKQRILKNSENRLKRILNNDERADPDNQNILNGGSMPTDYDSLKNECDGIVPQIPERTSHAFPQLRTPLISDLVKDLDSTSALADFPLSTFLGYDANEHSDLLSSLESVCRLAAGSDGTTTDAASQKVSYQGPAFLIDPGDNVRIRFIFLLGVVSRLLLLPCLPVGYAKLFGPLYLLEVLLFSLCFVYRTHLEHSSMSLACSLMSLCGFHSIFVKLVRISSAALELILRDMWSYSFSFFITHALCQQLEIIGV